MVDTTKLKIYEEGESHEIGTFKRYKTLTYDDENDKMAVEETWSVVLFRINSYIPVTETDIRCVWVHRFYKDTDVWT